MQNLLTVHCITSRKVADLIPDKVIEMFHLPNPSGCTITLKSYQSLIEASTKSISWGGGVNGSRCIVLTTFPPSYADCLWILGASTSWRLQRLSRPLQGLVLRPYSVASTGHRGLFSQMMKWQRCELTIHIHPPPRHWIRRRIHPLYNSRSVRIGDFF